VELVRKPIGVGTIYPGDRDKLEIFLRKTLRGVDRYRVSGFVDRDIASYIVPHDPLKKITSVALSVYTWLRRGSVDRYTYVLIGPNHTELGKPVAVYPGGVWDTPLGRAYIDEEFVEELTRIDIYMLKLIYMHIVRSIALSYSSSYFYSFSWVEK